MPRPLAVDHTVKASITLPESIHTIAKAEARARGVSFSGFLVELLRRHYQQIAADFKRFDEVAK